MTKLPIKKQLQKDYIQSAVRFPPELHSQLKVAAEANGRSLNAEIVARLRDQSSERVLAELTEVKRMLKALIEMR